jgi:hypothetical protein
MTSGGRESAMGTNRREDVRVGVSSRNTAYLNGGGETNQLLLLHRCKLEVLSGKFLSSASSGALISMSTRTTEQNQVSCVAFNSPR